MPTRKPIPQKSAADFVENLSILGKAILIIRENRIAATIIYGLVVGFLGHWSGVFTSFFATTKTVAVKDSAFVSALKPITEEVSSMREEVTELGGSVQELKGFDAAKNRYDAKKRKFRADARKYGKNLPQVIDPKTVEEYARNNP